MKIPIPPYIYSIRIILTGLNDEILKNILLKMEFFKDIFLLNRVRQIIHHLKIVLNPFFSKLTQTNLGYSSIQNDGF
jgi:hypothetical protein